MISPPLRLLGIASLCATTLQPGSAAACNVETGRIVIDVGHTARTPGAISARGRPEHQFNTDLAFVLKTELRIVGFQHVYMIVRDHSEDLSERVWSINSLKPDVIVSLHHDSVQSVYQKTWEFQGAQHRYSDRYAGWSLLISPDNSFGAESRDLASRISDQLLSRGLPFSKHHAEPIRGEDHAFVDPSRGIYRYDGLAVLKRATAPAVLVEAGIILNREEETALRDPRHQQRIGSSIAAAIRSFCEARDTSLSR